MKRIVLSLILGLLFLFFGSSLAWAKSTVWEDKSAPLPLIKNVAVDQFTVNASVKSNDLIVKALRYSLENQAKNCKKIKLVKKEETFLPIDAFICVEVNIFQKERGWREGRSYTEDKSSTHTYTKKDEKGNSYTETLRETWTVIHDVAPGYIYNGHTEAVFTLVDAKTGRKLLVWDDRARSTERNAMGIYNNMLKNFYKKLDKVIKNK